MHLFQCKHIFLIPCHQQQQRAIRQHNNNKNDTHAYTARTQLLQAHAKQVNWKRFIDKTYYTPWCNSISIRENIFLLLPQAMFQSRTLFHPCDEQVFLTHVCMLLTHRAIHGKVFARARAPLCVCARFMWQGFFPYAFSLKKELIMRYTHIWSYGNTERKKRQAMGEKRKQQ